MDFNYRIPIHLSGLVATPCENITIPHRFVVYGKHAKCAHDFDEVEIT